MSDDIEPEYAEAEVFGHRFRDLSGLIADLITLEREGAVYSHFWNDASQSFLYYRISLLPSEIYQYVEAHLARREFQDASANGSDFAEALQAITNPEIRERVHSWGNYGSAKLKDGTVVDLRGCAASFYPQGMEALLCGQRHDRYEILPKISTTDRNALVIAAIDNFPVIRRFLENRKHKRPPITMENEYDTQDILFCLLRASFNDASLEEWTPPHAGSSKRIDIVLPSIQTVLEVKHIRDRRHAKRVGDELKIDIESYHTHPKCKQLIAFVHDPEQYIVDPEPLMRDLSGFRKKGESEFEVHVLVR